MNKLIDTNFGINRQAAAVLMLLDREPDFADYDNGFYKVYTQTRPWYNGRENGFVLSMSKSPGSKEVIHIAVFEHRNSDSICALKWSTNNFYWNHPLEDPNIFELSYGPGKGKFDVAYSVEWGNVGKMADWVYEELEIFYNSQKEKEK